MSAKFQIDRRSFLKLLGIASAGMAASCDSDPPPCHSKGLDVVVLGGGLSGLCSAYELRKRGFNIVAILEAQGRTGGRVWTLREGFANSQYAELGATRIADTHYHTLAYARQFGLKLKEYSSGDGMYYLKGKSFLHKDGDAWPDWLQLKDAERSMGADSLVLSYEQLEELGVPTLLDWPTGDALAYNDLTLEGYLRQKGAGDDVVRIERAINGTEVERDAALYWLMADVVDAKWDKTYGIVGGNDQLPKAFTTELGSVVKYNSPVVGLAQDQQKVTVTYQSEGQLRTVTADLAVCGLPFPLLRKLNLEGAGFSADKRRLVDTLSMMPVARCNLQTKSRFWNGMGIGGLKVFRTDTPAERLWDMSNIQDGDSGMLTGYMMSNNAESFARQSTDQRLTYFRGQVAPFLPNLDAELINSAVKVWQEDPWAAGAWAYYKSGEMRDMFPLAKQRQGRVFFCGEHTSAWSGWMQGAFESAIRVVNEILG